MLYTVRLTSQEGKLLAAAARRTSRKRSELVREAIATYCVDTLRRSDRCALDAVADRVGCARSGRRDLGTRAHAHFREALIAKRRTSPR